MSSTLKDHCALKGGTGFPESLQGQQEGDLPFIKVSDMSLSGNEKLITTANNYVNRDVATKLRASIFPPGSTVFAKVGAALLLNRRRVLTSPTIIDNNMMAATPTEADPGFLYHFLCSVDLENCVQTGALPSVNQSTVGAIPFPDILPPEQQLISEYLSTVDEAIEQTEALIAKTQQIKAGLMHDLFTRGVTPDGQLRPPREEVPQLYKESRLGWIPEEWEIERLGDVVSKITDGSHQSVTTDPAGEVPFLYVSCVRENEIRWQNAARVTSAVYQQISPGRTPKAGIILYTAVGSYGFAALVRSGEPFAFQRHIAYIDASSCAFDPAFLAWLLNAPRTRRCADRVAEGNAQKTVTLKELSRFPVPRPPRPEQERIARAIDVVTEKVGALEFDRRKVQLIKRALMHDLLTGRVRVAPKARTAPVEVAADV